MDVTRLFKGNMQTRDQGFKTMTFFFLVSESDGISHRTYSHHIFVEYMQGDVERTLHLLACT
jgi:hypothetical protein